MPLDTAMRLKKMRLSRLGLVPNKKNAAKRSRQHAGGKYREYAQRSVCFVNKQVP